jgi:hypothetical protein
MDTSQGFVIDTKGLSKTYKGVNALQLRALVGGSEDGRLIIAQDSGHYITFDRPDVVIAEIGAMLGRLRSESRADLPTVAKARIP